MRPKPGSRYKSQVGDTEIIVVRAPAGDVELTCGGHPVISLDEAAPPGISPAAGLDAETPIGKRYVDDSGAIEVLVTKAGAGTLALGNTPLTQKSARPLPSSD